MNTEITSNDRDETEWTEIFSSDRNSIAKFTFEENDDLIIGEAEQKRHQLRQTLLQDINRDQTKDLYEIWRSIQNIFRFN